MGSAIGRGLGQQTGGTPESSAIEARRILTMMAHVTHEEIEEAWDTSAAANFIRDLRKALESDPDHFAVTGKQLFYLRDIYSALIEKGLI